VHGSNAARYEQSFRAIADQVKIPSRKNPKENIFELVHDWLRIEKNGKWVLVLDNIDNADFLLRPQSKNSEAQEGSRSTGLAQPLFQHIPLTENGSILITTRSRDIAFKLVEKSNIIAVEPMDEGQALTLFTTKLGNQSDETGVSELAAALEFMPLAIVQAAAYIRERTPRCPVQQYMKEFRKSDKKKTNLLTNNEGHLRRDWEAKNSILITWQISFDHILQTRRSAADLLSLMSFFDRQGIPEALVRNRRVAGGVEREMSESDDSASETSVDDGFEDDVLALRNYSFISITVDASTFEMHALVQLATRKWLEDQGQLERWKESYIANLCAAFPPGNYENWAKCRALFPHAKLALTQRPKGEESLKDWALLLYNAAWYAWESGSASDAEKMSAASMKIRMKQNGTEHKDTLASMAMVAIAYKLSERWEEAEQLEVQVTEIEKRVRGLEHPDTLIGMGNLASTYREQGRWKEAEELEVQVMEIQKRVLGLEHPDTLISMGNLASTYGEQGRCKEAEELEVQVIKIKKRVLGMEHPSTLTSMGNLALTYAEQGRWKEAEELEVQVIKIKKRVLGMEHPSTLTSMGNLASTYREQGRWKEAEELEVQVMEIQKRVLGLEHPDTLISMGNLASTYREQGRWKEAEELEVQVIETKKRVLGLEHPDTLTSMSNLAYILRDQGYEGRAISLMKECVQLREKVLGPQHHDTRSSLQALSEWQLESVHIGGQ
jgi:tetratricopeptide (TPR) repeat protein